MSLKGPGGDCGGAQRDKDPGDLAGDLGRPCVAGKGGERRALTRGPSVAERGRGRWQVGKGDAAWALVAGPCGASAWVSWAESACWAAREEGLG